MKSKAVIALMNLERKKRALDVLARRYSILAQDLNRDMRTLRALGKSKNTAPNEMQDFLRKEAKKHLNDADRVVKEMKKVTTMHAKISTRLNHLSKKAAVNLAREMV